jgi:hypothetical protein
MQTDDNDTDRDDEQDAPGFDPIGPPVSNMVFSTAEILVAVAAGIRSQVSPLVDDKAVQAMRVAFTAIVDAIERRDPAARTVLRQEAVARVMKLCDGDPRCAPLARDASDPLHPEWLMIASDHHIRRLAAQARTGSGSGPGGGNIRAVLGGLMGR